LSFVIALLLLSVLMNSVSQLSLKRGILTLRGVSLQSLSRPAVLLRILTSPFIVIWVALLVPSMLLWLKAIAMTDLSFAYPFLSLNLVFISFGATVFLKERVTTLQWSGIVLILLGIVLISRS
jgi:undecaprenyl phosphate-alpha-L-ara4N flippase subunit ArnE